MATRIRPRTLSVLMALALFAGASQAAEYLLPDTLWVKVTFYDYHYGPPNPDFGACNCGTNPGMVQDTLDYQRKPKNL